MQTMSPLDASFLHIEDAVTHMHIGSVGIFEGPPPGPDEVTRGGRGAAAAWCPATARRCASCRSRSGRPTWVDDPHFNLDYHVRRTALPAPGGDEELRNLVGRVMSQQLDRAKPLWEMWVAEGLDDGRWALISKTHHCMVDGVSATDLLSVILEHRARADADGRRLARRARAEPGRACSPTRWRCARPARTRAMRTVLAAARGPRRVAMRQLADGPRAGQLALAAAARPRRRARSTARSARTAAGTGRMRGCRTSSGSGRRHGGRSTTSCWR